MSEALACDYCLQVFHVQELIESEKIDYSLRVCGVSVNMRDRPGMSFKVLVKPHWPGKHVCRKCEQILITAALKECRDAFIARYQRQEEEIAAREAELKPVSDAVKATWKGTNPDAV